MPALPIRDALFCCVVEVCGHIIMLTCHLSTCWGLCTCWGELYCFSSALVSTNCSKYSVYTISYTGSPVRDTPCLVFLFQAGKLRTSIFSPSRVLIWLSRPVTPTRFTDWLSSVFSGIVRSREKPVRIMLLCFLTNIDIPEVLSNVVQSLKP